MNILLCKHTTPNFKEDKILHLQSVIFVSGFFILYDRNSIKQWLLVEAEELSIWR